MNTQKFLAIDLGAESGRGIVADFDGERLALSQVGRFATGRADADIDDRGRRRWDFERIWREIDGIVKCGEAESGGSLSGVGADSWGVDFGLLDGNGALLQQPVQYRDPSHAAAKDEVIAAIGLEALWDASAVQPVAFNTLFQLLARQRTDPGLLENAQRLLMIPDLVHYRLAAGKSAQFGVEASNASTTGMTSLARDRWQTELLDRLNIPHHFLGPIHEAGARLGTTLGGTPVYAPATHDTASAIVAVPAQRSEQGNWAYLSSGTWSLLGIQLEQPELSRKAFAAGLSNEAGAAGTAQLLDNIMGLWLVQECRRSLAASEVYTYDELTAMAASAPGLTSLVDATDSRFMSPADMRAEICAACDDRGHVAPSDTASLIRCCLDSLALAYRRAVANLSRITGRTIDVLHVVGGGSQNMLLNQLTADACGIPVLVGPAEATALGNVVCQMIGAGAINSWQEGREICRRSFPVETYMPDESRAQRWIEAESKLSRLV